MVAPKVNSLFQILRPKQWVKNLLILAAPIASANITSNVSKLLLSIFGFTTASILGYLINDWRDRERDKLHPKKKFRPLASGELERTHYYLLLFVFGLLTLLSCLALGQGFSIVVSAYLMLTIIYTLVFKAIPVLEMFWLALGFLIRAIAGSVVIDEQPTGWFIITIYFGSLFLISCKRRSEMSSTSPGETRDVLRIYPIAFIDSLNAVFAGMTAITYSQWVIQEHSDSYLAYATIVPFSCALIAYLLMSAKGEAEEPESDLFANKLVLSMMIITALMLLLVFYS